MKTLSIALLCSLLPGTPVPLEEAQLTWIFIRTGPKDGQLPPDESTAATTGHFENMTRMTEAGHLLVAGPLGPPRAEADHRGIFVIDEADPARALEIASSDPAVKAGVFRLEALPWRTSDPMDRIVELDRAELTARAAASPDGQAIWEGRGYTLATVHGEEADELLAPLAEEGLVLFRGALGDEGDARVLACLNVADADEAQSMLSQMSELVDGEVRWQLHGWYASRGLVDLPFLRAHPDAPTFDLRAVEGESYAKRVEVFGVPICASEGVPDAATLEMAHLLAQYLDPDEDGEPDAGELPTRLVLRIAQGPEAGFPEGWADASLRKSLGRIGLELPAESPDGGYRLE